MSDFDDSDASDFTAADEIPEADLPLGLVVPVKARLIFDPVTGLPLWDELRDIEADFRARGRPDLVFEEEDPSAADDVQA